MTPTHDPTTIYAEGGKWLGAARNYLKWHVPGGERVIWEEDLLTMTVRQIEELAAEAVAADRQDRASPRECDRRRWARAGRGSK